MDLAQLETEINAAWDNRDAVNASTTGAVRDAVAAALALLDSGTARVAEPAGDHQWTVNQWLKKAVLLSFRLNDMQTIPSGTIFEGAGESVWWDKVPPKFSGWDEARFPRNRFPRRAGLYCSSFCLYRTKCRLDAKLCESWCLCWQRNNG